MRVIIKEDYDNLSKAAAEYVISRIERFRLCNDRPFVLGLPTGSSPIGMYSELVNAYRAGRISFKNVVTFNMDEYVGLPENHPQSYHSFMRQHLFDHIDIPDCNVHILDGNAADLNAECRAYEDAIAEVGGIDLFVGGIGPDGHIAFNEPFSSLHSRTRIKTLTADTRIANARFFGGNPESVPRHALTVGVGTVISAREVLILCSGHAKARALQAAIEGAVCQQWTVSALQMHPNSIIFCDEASCHDLRVGTYRYFKEIENL